MDRIIAFFTDNWQRKLVALIAGSLVWFYVNRAIYETKTIQNIPIKVVNLPADKTIAGIKPNGMLRNRINLTLTGPKNIVEDLETGDMEVLIDASTIHKEDWVFQMTKKNLISLNPNIDLSRQLSDIKYPELVIKISKLVSTKIPITILPPVGKAPKGYIYLDIWPQQLMQTIVAAEEELNNIPRQGLELAFDLGSINLSELDKIKPTRNNFHDDEVSFFIPPQWKKITLPFPDSPTVDLNDPDAQNLHIDFLRKEYLPFEKELPISIFYPLSSVDKINPETFPLAIEGLIQSKKGIPFISTPLYVRDVSSLFLKVIRDNMQIVFTAQPDIHGENLPWSISVAAVRELEDKYVSMLISTNVSASEEPKHTLKREAHLRNRFRDYLQRVTLYTAPDHRLHMQSKMTENKISINPTPNNP